MNDIRVSVAVKKYGRDLGHEFMEYGRCKNCGITQEEFMRNYPASGYAGEYVLCEKIIQQRKKQKLGIKPRIKKISRKKFWILLYEFFKEQQKEFHTFRNTYQYFWRKHKINRSTFKKLFNEIYQERKFDGKNAIHVYGSPSGAFRDEDRLPMNTPRGYREWSLWGLDQFDNNNSYYEKQE